MGYGYLKVQYMYKMHENDKFQTQDSGSLQGLLERGTWGFNRTVVVFKAGLWVHRYSLYCCLYFFGISLQLKYNNSLCYPGSLGHAVPLSRGNQGFNVLPEIVLQLYFSSQKYFICKHNYFPTQMVAYGIVLYFVFAS